MDDLLTQRAVKQIGAAICIQAVKDWEQLCRLVKKGKIIDVNGQIMPGPTFECKFLPPKRYVGDKLPGFSFAEIETFFVTYAEMYTDMDVDKIMASLQAQRAKANSVARNKFK